MRISDWSSDVCSSDLQIAETKRKFGQKTALGRRRTVVGEAPTAVIVPIESYIEREPLTVFLSEKGWIRAVKGHVTDAADVKYKEGDRSEAHTSELQSLMRISYAVFCLKNNPL